MQHQLAYGLFPSTPHCHTSWEIPSSPSLCPLPPYNTFASPRPLSALTQTDPPRLPKKILGGNIPQTILTGERIDKFHFELSLPPPPCPLLSYAVELVGIYSFFFSFFLEGGFRGSWQPRYRLPSSPRADSISASRNCCKYT